MTSGTGQQIAVPVGSHACRSFSHQLTSSDDSMCGATTPSTSGNSASALPSCREDVRKRIGTARAQLMLDATIPPVAEVTPGTTISVDTLDCVAGLMASRPVPTSPMSATSSTGSAASTSSAGHSRFPGASPETSIKVTILDIYLCPGNGKGIHRPGPRILVRLPRAPDRNPASHPSSHHDLLSRPADRRHPARNNS